MAPAVLAGLVVPEAREPLADLAPPVVLQAPVGPVSPFAPGSLPQAASVKVKPMTTATAIFFIVDPSAPNILRTALKRRSDTLATEIRA